MVETSQISKNCVAANEFVSCYGLIVGRSHRNNKQKRKIAEALLIKNLKPLLNVQEKSIALKLFHQSRFLEAPIPISFNSKCVAMKSSSF